MMPPARGAAGAAPALTIDVTGGDTISSLLSRQASMRGEALFALFEDDRGELRQITYRELDRQASRMANLLKSLGVGKGDSFHVHLPNCLEFYTCWFGAARLGALIVPTNPLATSHELGYMLTQAECRLSITQTDLLPAVARAVTGNRASTARAHPIFVARTDHAPAGTRLLAPALLTAPELPPPAADGVPQPLDPVSVLYTSGTTSRPKGVLITNASYLHAGEVVAQHLRLRPDDRLLIVLPLFHGNAQYYSTMAALVTGASIALMERFSASRFAAQASRSGATVASLFAAPIRMLLAQPERPEEGHQTLRATMFAQSVTQEQVADFERRYRCPLVQLYGMTETVAPATLNPLYGERRNLSMGRPVLPTPVRVVDAAGRDVEPGRVGQLLVGGEAGRTLMAGYLNDPAATAEALRDGWLYTGDMVRCDADGYLFFVDRAKDMIKRAGENVAAGEIEQVINEHPGVFESAAIGIADAMRDEAIKVFVVRRQGAEIKEAELLAWCRERLAKFKIPSEIEFVEALPRTSVGKIQKHVLRAREAQRQKGDERSDRV